MKPKFFIITTVSDSLPFFKGQLNVLKKDFTVSLVSSPGVHLEEMGQEYDVSKFPIKMEREISLLKDLKSFFKLLVLFLKEKPKLVHANTPKASLLAIMAAWFSRVPARVYYVHGLRYQSILGKKKILLMLMERMTCWFATEVIAVSNGIKETLISDNITSKNIIIIGNGSINGIDTSYFNPDKVIEIKDDKLKPSDFVFGFVGRLVKDKGLEELILAFQKLSKTSKNIKLLIVGAFEENMTLSKEIIDTLYKNPNILYVGPQKDVRPFFKAMDVFVLPSYREGFGIVLIEAGAMKIPSITTDIAGCNEVIIDNKTGFLIKRKDVKDLFEKMKYVVENKQQIKMMKENARDRVHDRYSQDTVWKNAKETYLKIIKNHV
ncbi:glycosyltransferase family 4 protein [Myroides ceti]|uniref:Glycosyltransferase family 4 protein n=1 Tax=Paenimyroides ceti TaxID=395087 RepID=A0ABT8CXF4_9FLAO|nr:glycosyltransferase family 4 protein [Paenimyroides ceti]MDN3707765.1 glycosyltransferase family 4 protein [Paenimyroides ceti]MDN3709013.1 glycosyltransferase family 4 protein [Paenimyroides ceti]MDN3709187.1 glycosyltransferase family 4 protein [Paenimyroides ceti]